MNALSFPPSDDDEIFKLCAKECGIITSTEDQQYFALGCTFCREKFLYFDAFIGHIQTLHSTSNGQKDIFHGMFSEAYDENSSSTNNNDGVDEEDLTDADPSLLVPQMVMIKEEVLDDESPQVNDDIIPGFPNINDIEDASADLFQVKLEHQEPEVSMEMDENNYADEDYGNYEDYPACDVKDDEDGRNYQGEEEEDANYDDLVEESLLGGAGLTMHIKDRKMIQFLIDAYRRNTFLWDHRNPQFRDRLKRAQFLQYMLMEFKRRFNISLAKDAVTRKWDNLRTVYKRECNRMSQENTNVSTLWYFKELHFLNRLYGGNQKMSEAVVKETVYRRRYSALWNDVSTTKLLAMVEQYPCFYDKYHIDYRSKEKRGEALQIMAAELQKMIDVTTIQISKRISQLRFDYSKQKQERLVCEQKNKVFVPSYTYYDQMHFMDADVAPFKCDYCPMILQTPREYDLHTGSHQPSTGCTCTICHLSFLDIDQLNRHKQTHASALKEVKYFCDLCTASFREKTNYEEHMRRHNDELFLPSLVNSVSSSSIDSSMEKPFICDICGKAFSNSMNLSSHRTLHASYRSFKCDYPSCGKVFGARQSMMEHVKQHYNEDEYICEVCKKSFKSIKNLQNHKQIHDAVKKYVCKICGSAFAQAAGLYLHKRRHNRPNSRVRQSY